MQTLENRTYAVLLKEGGNKEGETKGYLGSWNRVSNLLFYAYSSHLNKKVFFQQGLYSHEVISFYRRIIYWLHSTLLVPGVL
jgi:hypothetical protein